jgi:hypothetical protein
VRVSSLVGMLFFLIGTTFITSLGMGVLLVFGKFSQLDRSISLRRSSFV